MLQGRHQDILLLYRRKVTVPISGMSEVSFTQHGQLCLLDKIHKNELGIGAPHITCLSLLSFKRNDRFCCDFISCKLVCKQEWASLKRKLDVHHYIHYTSLTSMTPLSFDWILTARRKAAYNEFFFFLIFGHVSICKMLVSYSLFCFYIIL